MLDWLKDTVFYEIYPQSFMDSNGDGIGDIQGIISKLDYINNLGCNALWINPCFDSPFKDAGYDVRDYKKIAPRYGTNEDMYELFEKAHGKGIRVLLDLVPGHTSEEHEWFKQSGQAFRNEYSERYIWTHGAFQGIGGHPYIGGECDRDGCYMLNFFKCQPALNYGFHEPKEPWQKGIDDPDCLATREAMKDIILFWLEKGCDGFRVDMADSLVKEDGWGKPSTCEVWRDILGAAKKAFPEAAFVSEWSGPEQALNCGFDMDFYLDHQHNGYNSLLRNYEVSDVDRSYFKKDGGGDVIHFLEEYCPRYEHTREVGYISLISGNHDTYRISNNLSPDEQKIAMAFILTMPGVPFVYYGDEIGMRYLDIPTKEGGYQRTGSRTPMQWNDGADMGFSSAAKDLLYLPIDDDPNAPSVSGQESDKGSLLNAVRSLISLRRGCPDLQADSGFEVIYARAGEPLFVYRRGNHVVAVNPSDKDCRTNGAVEASLGRFENVYSIGDKASCGNGGIVMSPQSFAVFKQI